MKKKLVQTMDSGGNTYGQVSNPLDLMNAQDFVHDRISQVTHDFINDSRDQEVTGFAFGVGAGNAFNITIATPGRVYTKNGLSYEQPANVTLAFAAADATLPRLDLIVAVLDDAVNAELNLIPFVRLRTAGESAANTPPYPPANISVPTQLHWRAVPQIKTGTPAATPTAPTAASNEIPLYLVQIGPGVTALSDADVLDLRDMPNTLRTVSDRVEQARVDASTLLRRVAVLENAGDVPIDLTQIYGSIRSLSEILADLQRQSTASRDFPEIIYARPKFPLTDKRTSQIISTYTTESGQGVVDIEIGAHVNFGDAEQTIQPSRFTDPTVNARFRTVGSPAAHTRRDVALPLGSVDPGDCDGFVDFDQRTPDLTPARSKAASAARDTQFVEIYGGTAANNNSALGDWYSYDVTNDILTLRTPLTALPSADQPALFSYGDGVHVLLVCSNRGSTTPRWFKIHTGTGAVTEITTTKPTGTEFHGDLLTAGKIFIVGVTQNPGDAAYWEFDTATSTFTNLGVTGNIPLAISGSGSGCFFSENKFVFLNYDNFNTGTGKTFLFDRTTLQWTHLSINVPYDQMGPTLPAVGFRLANVNGRPLLIGGFINAAGPAGSGSLVWELKPPKTGSGLSRFTTQEMVWSSWQGTFDALMYPAFCSTLGTDSLPNSKAFFFGGTGKWAVALTRIYSSIQAGLKAITHGGLPGVTISESSTFAQFEVPSFTATGAVAAYRAIFTGSFNSSNIKIEVSFNDGVNWYEITNDKTFVPATSGNPAIRRMRVTLYNSKSEPPILTNLTEVLDGDGTQLEDRVVIRYDVVGTAVKALYLTRTGDVIISTTIEPSTPDKAIIHRINPAGDDSNVFPTSPRVLNYVNRRRPRIKYTGTAPTGLGFGFFNEMAVPVRFAHGYGVKPFVGSVDSQKIYPFETGGIAFNGSPNFSGGNILVVEGDSWIVEIDG